MPTYRQVCESGHEFEFYSSVMTSEDPQCPTCHCSTQRAYRFAPGVIWSKALVDYNDPSKENAQRDFKNGGFWVNERDSDQAKAAGRPIQTFIRTVKDQEDYCKREGLINPRDIPGNLSVTKDGAGWETANKAEI